MGVSPSDVLPSPLVGGAGRTSAVQLCEWPLPGDWVPALGALYADVRQLPLARGCGRGGLRIWAVTSLAAPEWFESCDLTEDAAESIVTAGLPGPPRPPTGTAVIGRAVRD